MRLLPKHRRTKGEALQIMGEVIKLNAALDPDIGLEAAKGGFQDVLIIGYDKEGYLDIRASLDFLPNDILFAIEQFKLKLLNGDYSDEQG